MSNTFDFQAIYQQLKQLHEDQKLSFYEANIFDFVSVIKETPSLLTAEDRLSLESLVEELPDDIQEISNQITKWYENENRRLIEDAIFERPTYRNDRGAAGRVTQINSQEFKALIKNVVRQSQPKSSTNQSSTN